MYSPIMAFLCFWLLVAVQQPSGCIATKRSSSRQGTKAIPFKPTEMKGGAGPANALSRRADNPSGSRRPGSRFGSRRTRGSNEVAAASLSAAALQSSAEHSGGKVGMSPRHRQQTLSEVGFLQQQQQQQQQQGGGGEEEEEEQGRKEERAMETDFGDGGDGGAMFDLEDRRKDVDLDEAEASGEMIGKTALEAWTTAAEGGNVYVVRSFVAKTASDRTKFPAMTPHVGVIQSYNGQTGLFRVSYADGDSEDMDADEATNCMV